MREEAERIYSNRTTVIAWTVGCTFVAFIAIGASLSERSAILTGSLFGGFVLAGFVGAWIISKNQYFISDATFGYRDLFGSREVILEDVKSVEKVVDRSSVLLRFWCQDRIVEIPFDPTNQDWLKGIQSKLEERSIKVQL